MKLFRSLYQGAFVLLGAVCFWVRLAPLLEDKAMREALTFRCGLGWALTVER